MDKPKKRALDSFANQKMDKHRRSKQKPFSTQTVLNNYNDYYVNFVFANFTFLSGNQYADEFILNLDFLKTIKYTFPQSNVILYTPVKTDITVAISHCGYIDYFVELNANNFSLEERPLLQLRRYLLKKKGISALAGPFILFTKCMNSHNNKQYDIVKDMRRFFLYDGNLFININYKELLNDTLKSIKQFYSF